MAAVVAFGPGGAGSSTSRSGRPLAPIQPVQPVGPQGGGTSGTSGTGTGGSVSAIGPNGAPLAFVATFSGSSLSRSKWNPYITDAAASGQPWNSNGQGGSSPAGGPDLQDLEYDLPSQVRVDGGLQLTARRQATPGVLGNGPLTYPWRSGAVSTYGKFEFDGGYLSVTARMPTGSGLWPSVFLLPGYSMAGHPDGNEIDLFEGGYLGQGPPADNVAWHLHVSGRVVGGVVDVGTRLSAGYHTYGLDWVPGKSITWYFDGRRIAQVTSATVAIPNEPMELIVDLQVANSATASFHDQVDAATPSTATMDVRRIAVYSTS